MASDFTSLMLRGALFAGLAVLILLALRRPLRRWLGAALAYQAWLLVPLVVMASLAPGRPAQALQSVQVLRPVQSLAAQATAAAPSSGHADTLLLAWAIGAAAMALRFVLGQRAFLRQARAGSAGPASVGLLRPRIVVPDDFAARYSPSEQALVLAHERAHIARGDLWGNLLASLLQCAFWFNPLIHLGARAFRQDQELACDAAVVQQHRGQRRAYAEALLKSHPGVHPTGLHCHWQSHHPTKERIMSLQHTPPGTFRRVAGRCMLALLAAGAFGATLGARAEQATGPMYSVAMQIDEGGKRSTPRVLARAQESFAVATDAWRLEMVVSQADKPGEVWLKSRVFKGSEQVGAPALRTRIGEPATVRIGDGGSTDFSVAMTVTQQP